MKKTLLLIFTLTSFNYSFPQVGYSTYPQMFGNELNNKTVSARENEQIDNFKSNLINLEDENGNSLLNSNNMDTLIFNGEATTNYFGRNVSNAGDVNGDGYSDVIVGAPNYNNGVGRAYIYFGGSSMDNIADVTLTGETTNNFGFPVATAGDVNGDGYSDVIIGAPDYNNMSSVRKAYIFYGGLSMNNVPDVIFSNSIVSFSYSVATAGDVNGDGYSDVVIGAVGYNNTTGRAFIFYGGVSMDNIADVTMTGETINNAFGFSVSTAGDVNGDGFSDVVVGAVLFNNMAGRIYVFFGGVNMDNVADLAMSGEVENNWFGVSVSGLGDVNGDGYADIISGAIYYNGSYGRAYIFFGGSSMNNIADIVFTGDTTETYFGNSVSSPGDLNRDGYQDVIVGANNYDNIKGRAYIFYGGVSMDNIVDLVFTGEATNNNFAVSVSSAGDINRDGYSDIIVGAYNYNNGRGRSYIYYNLFPKPELIYPVNNSINNPLSINFKWKKYNPAKYYILTVSIDSLFNNTVVNDTIFIDTFKTVSGFQKGTKYFWKVTAIDTFGVAPIISLVWNFTTKPPIYSNIKLLFEGMYSPVFNQQAKKDTVTAFLHLSTSPFNIVDSARAEIDSISFTGFFKFLSASTGTYYISIKHLNSIETWSKSAGENLADDGSIYNYDFTTSISQAYGNNLKLKGSKYCLFSGDLNHDGYIDLDDLVPIFNDATHFGTGQYAPADLNGDSIVDLTDITICYNNSSNFVRAIQP